MGHLVKMLTDTGPLVAILNRNDYAHAQRTNVLTVVRGPLTTTWACFTEAMYLLAKSGGYIFQRALWKLHQDGRLQLHVANDSELARMPILMEQYHDAPMDLADATIVAAAETLQVMRVFTIDRHFYAYRTADKAAFEIVP